MLSKQVIIDKWIEEYDIDIWDAYEMYEELYGVDEDDAQDY